MAESTLAIAYKELVARLGFHLGYGRGADYGEPAWDANKTATITETLKSGLHLFYNCGYDWSFLKPVATLTITEAQTTVPLPDDYAAAEGPAVVGISGSSYGLTLGFGSTQAVDQAAARDSTGTGPPRYLCEEPLRGTTLTRGQRMQLRVWPIPDRDYTLTFPYRLNPDALNGTLPFAYGGAQHAQTLLQACKAAAERDVDGIAPGSPEAAQQQAFAQMLEASKALDRRAKPQSLGVNRDLSDRRRRTNGQVVPRAFLPIMIDGVIY